MESSYGPMGLRREHSYAEVLRAVQVTRDLLRPKRDGLKQYEDIFFSNLINDHAAYAGDALKSGFAHDQPRPPPERPDVFFDARSGNDDDDGGDDDGSFGRPFGRAPGNLPIQSGHAIFPPGFGSPPEHLLEELPNPRQNVIQEEALAMPPEPPGFIERLSDVGGFARQMAMAYAQNRLRAMGGAVVDGALDIKNFYTQEIPELIMQGWREAQRLGWRATASEESGIFQPNRGVIDPSLMFRSREAPERQSTFLDAQTLNDTPASRGSVQALRPRTHQEGGASSSWEPLRPRVSRHGGVPAQYFNIASRSPSPEEQRPRPSNAAQRVVIDEVAAAQPYRGERVQLSRNRAPPAIHGEPNPGMLADRAPDKASYGDIMQATAAPTAARRNKKRAGNNSGSPYVFPMSGPPPSQPPRPSSSSSSRPPPRRNKGPPR